MLERGRSYPAMLRRILLVDARGRDHEAEIEGVLHEY
jgi:hypothetical protein